MKHKIFILLSFSFLISCTKGNLPKFNQLEGIRVLAFQTNTPEVNPGATVTLNPIVSDIQATSLTYTANACIDPGISYGADPNCESNPTKIVLATNVALTIPGAAESWTGLADSLNVTIPIDAIIFAGRSAQETYNGVSYLVDYSLTNNLGQTVKSVKRILVSDSAKTSKNQNPITTQVFANGAAMTALSLSSKLNLTTDLTLASAESYILKNSNLVDQPQTEKLTTTWFVTDGETKYFRSVDLDSNEFTAPAQAPVGRAFYLLALTRDDRGGVSLVKKRF